MVTPGSDQIHNTIRRDGQLDVFESAGATLLANACGPCIGQWKRDDVEKGTVNSIISSFNRNFRGRQGPGSRTHLVSPAMAAAAAVTGHFTDVRDLMEGC